MRTCVLALLLLPQALALRCSRAHQRSALTLSAHASAPTPPTPSSTRPPHAMLALAASLSVLLLAAPPALEARADLVSTSLKDTLRDYATKQTRTKQTVDTPKADTGKPVEATAPPAAAESASSPSPLVSDEPQSPEAASEEQPSADAQTATSKTQKPGVSVALPSIAMPSIGLPSLTLPKDFKLSLPALPHFDTPPRLTIPLPVPLKQLPTGVELYQALLNDWRLPAIIALTVLLFDSVYDAKEVRSLAKGKDSKVKELTDSLRELQEQNDANILRLRDMESTSLSLSAQVSEVTSELKGKYALIDGMERDLAQVQASTATVGSVVNDGLYDALKTSRRLGAENEELRAGKSASEATVAMLREREEQIASSVRAFLLDRGFIGLGVANMLMPGTLVSVISDLAADDRPLEPEPSHSSEAELSALRVELEHKASALSALDTLKQQLALEASDAVAAGATEVRRGSGPLDDLAQISAALKEKDRTAALATAELASAREAQTAAAAALKEAETRFAAAEKAAASTGGASEDMETYLTQLKRENEELKARLIASDEQLLELMTDMQTKVNSAKEMAKMLNAQMLQKLSEFEAREGEILEELNRLKGDMSAANVAFASEKPVEKPVVSEGTDEVSRPVEKKAKSAAKQSIAKANPPQVRSAVSQIVEELRAIKPYILRRKTRKEIEDLFTQLKLAGEGVKLESMSKSVMLEQVERLVYS